MNIKFKPKGTLSEFSHHIYLDDQQLFTNTKINLKDAKMATMGASGKRAVVSLPFISRKKFYLHNEEH